MESASPQNNYHYNKSLQPLANQLRKNMTKAEACLWKYALRNRQMCGYPFRRQRPVLTYIADFMCQPLFLIIEVDGITHHFPEVYEKDLKKEAALKAVGFTVLRFQDDEVLNSIESVRAQLQGYIEQVERGEI